MRRSTKQYILVIMSSIILIGGGFAVAYFTSVNQLKEYYEERLNSTEQEIAANKRDVYVATGKILIGDKISKENVTYKEVLSSMPDDFFITEDDMGKLAVINIDPDATVLKNMITKEKVESEIRELEFSEFFLNSNLNENDFVDIRILFPNGEDYIVLSKKAVKNLSLENNNSFMWLNEEEILTISGAIVDAYLNSGCKLYTAKYIEPLIQEESKVTYVPNEAVMKLIKRDPNIVEIASKALNEAARINLENRLAKHKEINGESTINWNANGDRNSNTEGSTTEDESEVDTETEEEYYSVNKGDEYEYVE